MLPWCQWPEMRRLCLTGRACAREVLSTVHSRYLLQSSPSGLHAKLGGSMAQRLDIAQAAQSRGAPDALEAAFAQLCVLEQSTKILAINCGNYADLFEGV